MLKHNTHFYYLMALILIFSIMPIEIVVASQGPSQWAIVEIEDAKLNQLTTNRVLNNFQQNITREEFCELAVKLYEALSGEKATPISPNPFSDTKNPEILKAYKLGVVNGVKPDEFAPNQPVTRQEISVMLIRTLKSVYPQIDIAITSDVKFSDENELASWAVDSIKYLNQEGIIQGIGSNKINPTGNTTREQAILLVQRTYKRFLLGIEKIEKPLRVSQGGIPRTLDPQQSSDTSSGRVMKQIYETLIIFDDQMELAPGLAESWNQVDDVTYEFKLKRNIKFHNGEILTAKDVAFSLQRGISSPYVGHILGNIDAVKIIDDYTIQISTDTPFSPILAHLTNIGASIVNEKAVKAAGTSYDTNPIGTGPYKMSSWKDDEINLTAFNDYHDKNAKVDNIVFTTIPTDLFRLIALESDEIDIAYDIAFANIREVQYNKNLILYQDTNLITTYVGFNMEKAPFDDVHVRQAISYAIDMDEIIENVYYGSGTAGTNRA